MNIKQGAALGAGELERFSARIFSGYDAENLPGCSGHRCKHTYWLVAHCTVCEECIECGASPSEARHHAS